MTEIAFTPGAGTIRLDRTLESAVILGWNELMPKAATGVIDIQYHTGPERSLEYLKVWAASERGYWKLVCEYWTCSLWSHVPGLSFGKGYHSGDFFDRLVDVMQHETAFAKLPSQDGSILVRPPTESERTAAEGWLTGAFAEFGSGSAMPVVAA